MFPIRNIQLEILTHLRITKADNIPNLYGNNVRKTPVDVTNMQKIAKKGQVQCELQETETALTEFSSSVTVCVICSVKTAWERELSAFMLVEATVRHLLPSSMSRVISA